ncbi:Ig-like domain-containing protein [uncultured Subdoligranulum sp.]|uniref:Ig-like domain-containing protein n=1 Tax=uncultured Subdoligranulum sp. TaxID=512298 RepID=UPI00260F79F9|nr:Ig-like domain-containing protein [uncultured Subdoligranulum sp.]
MHLKKKLTALSLTAALLLTGCGTTITGVTLSLPDTMERGATATATPEYAYSGATPEQAKEEDLVEKLGLTWTSSDPAVVMVDADGNLAALGAGTAEVALASEDGTLSASGVITVVVSPTGLTMPETLTLTEGGEPQSAAATVEPEDATDKAVTYTSSDESIATVDAAGNVTPVAPGEATITAKLGGLEAACAVTVEEKEPEEPEEAPAETQTEKEQTAQDKTEQPADSADTAAEAPAASTAYGAVPFSAAAGTMEWFGIDSTDDAYWATLENINAYRAAVGVAPLSMDSGMSAIANQRTIDMLTSGVMSHDGYQTAEIIAQNYNSAQSVVDAWAASPGHYAAMTDPSYTVCGVGCAFEEGGATYWCVTLG